MEKTPETTSEPEDQPSLIRALIIACFALFIVSALAIEGMQQLDNFFRWLGY